MFYDELTVYLRSSWFAKKEKLEFRSRTAVFSFFITTIVVREFPFLIFCCFLETFFNLTNRLLRYKVVLEDRPQLAG